MITISLLKDIKIIHLHRIGKWTLMNFFQKKKTPPIFHRIPINNLG